MATVERTPSDLADLEGTERIDVLDPASGEVVAQVPDLGPEAVAELARRGRAAQPGWAALGFEGRAAVMRRMPHWLAEHEDEVVRVIQSETGKTYEDAVIADWSYGMAAFGFWAKHAEGYLADERVKSASPLAIGKKLVLRYEALGLVGVIGPWNYPLTNSFGDCIPALMAGNAVILKPSEVTPLTSQLLLEGLRECGLPADVLQVATGGGATGTALVDEVDMIMFTGSTATGKKVMARAAETLTAVSLELGGKDPMVVLADADLDRAANTAVYYGMLNTGQTCISVERVYVEAPVHDAFVAKLEERMRKLRNDRSTGPGTSDVGAITHPPQVDIIERHVEDARAKGARIVTGGHRGHDGQGGTWFEPTLIVGADHTMECMTEETFGPTLPVMRVADAAEGVRMANDSPYGLAASVFTKDVEKGEAIARQIQAGAVCVNDAVLNYLSLELPMGGWKASGLGTRHGAGGIRKYTRQQALFISRFHLKRELHTFPNRARETGLLSGFFKTLYGRKRA